MGDGIAEEAWARGMKTITPLDVALEAAAWGWHVFPCKRDKKPMTKHGFLDATTDPEKITEWWTKRPQALIGVATGASGLVVIDLDVKNGADGLDEWHALVTEHGSGIEATTLVETPSGGMHVYYRANGHKVGSNAGKLAPGVDVRAEGGYVIAGGSPGYEYVDDHGPGELAKLPAVLGAKLAYATTPTPLIPEAALTIPEGRRDASLASLGGTMRKRGMSHAAILAALTEENAEHCRPPLPAKDVGRIARSVSRYAPTEPPLPPPFEGNDDTGNANRFIRLYGERVRWCDLERRWYVYDDVRWKPDETLMVAELMRRALQSIFEDAARAADEKQAKSLGTWAAKSMGHARRQAALECAKSDRRIAVHPEQFDRGQYLLNCPNGTLDLETGTLRAHEPSDLLRKVTGAEYRPGERLPLWERVISEALGGDEDFTAGFQRACGYSATGDTREEVFFIMYGPTRSVKSTVCDALAAALGDYVHNGVSSDTWVEQRNVGGARGDLVQLAGVRMAISPESSKKNTMATALLKAFTGGDPITAAAKYQHEQTMIPTAKVWLHTNEIPHLPDDDEAIWRRAIVFPFKHPPAVPDPAIKATLKDAAASGAAVLAWVVDGFAAWQRCGLAVPDIVKHETLCVRLDMDPLQEWWVECCRPEEGIRTSNATLRESYEAWRKAYHVGANVGAKEWGMRLRARGLEPYISHGKRGWVGVAVAGTDVEQVFKC